MSRWKAASIHLAISALIGLAVATLLFGLWYPPPYSHGAGADGLIVLLLGVDLILGPLLTLVVFKAGKKSLRMDLGIIAALQLAALGYGLHVVVQARPAFVVAAVDRFNLVTANELEPTDLAQAAAPFDTIPWTGPRLAAAPLPEDPKLRDELLFSGLAGKDIEKFPQHYVDYASAAPALLTRAKPLSLLRASHADAGALIDNWLQRNQRAESEIVWLPLMMRMASVTMLLDVRDGRVLGNLPIDPW